MSGPSQEKNLSDQSITTEGPVLKVGDTNVNDKTGLQVAIGAFGISFLAIGLAIAAILIAQNQISRAMQEKSDREREVNNKLIVSENHWRDLEVTVKSQTSEIERLKQELSNVDRRR